MSKLNAKKTSTPKSSTTPKAAPQASTPEVEASADAPAPTAKKKNGMAKYRGMSKPARLDITLAATERGLAKAEQQTRKYVLADALACIARAQQEVAKAREFIITLPADWKPPVAAKVTKDAKPALAVGSVVAIRDKFAPIYAEFMPTSGLTVTRAVNGKVMVKSADGAAFGPIARGHLVLATPAPEAPAAEEAPAA